MVKTRLIQQIGKKLIKRWTEEMNIGDASVYFEYVIDYMDLCTQLASHKITFYKTFENVAEYIHFEGDEEDMLILVRKYNDYKKKKKYEITLVEPE